jgi:hypothetical protein
MPSLDVRGGGGRMLGTAGGVADLGGGTECDTMTTNRPPRRRHRRSTGGRHSAAWCSYPVMASPRRSMEGHAA